MTKPDILMQALAECNSHYRQMIRKKKPIIKSELKDVTPIKEIIKSSFCSTVKFSFKFSLRTLKDASI